MFKEKNRARKEFANLSRYKRRKRVREGRLKCKK